MRALNLQEIEQVSGGVETGGLTDSHVPIDGTGDNVQDAGEITVTDYKPLVSVVVPNTITLQANVDIMPSVSTGVKVNLNISSFLAANKTYSSSTASGRVPSNVTKIVGTLQ